MRAVASVAVEKWLVEPNSSKVAVFAASIVKAEGYTILRIGSPAALPAVVLMATRLTLKFIPKLLVPFELIQLALVAVLPLMAKAMVSAPVPAINVGDPPKSFPILALLAIAKVLPIIWSLAVKIFVFTPPLAVRLPAVSVILPAVTVTPPAVKVKFPVFILMLPPIVELPAIVKATEGPPSGACRSNSP